MSWSRFTYWKRGITVKPPLKKAPKGSNKPLILHQIENGDFDPSPYLLMIDKEEKMFQKEIDKWKQENPDAHYETFRNWHRSRLAVFNKRKIKLDKEFWNHHYSRMDLFRKQLRDYYLLDLWDEVLELSPETPMEFFNLYGQLKTQKIKQVTEN